MSLISNAEDKSWVHDAPSWLQIIGVMFAAGVAITATFYQMFFGLKEELARVDERQKFVLSSQKMQDDLVLQLKRDRDEQFREITRQLNGITAEITALKVAFAQRSK